MMADTAWDEALRERIMPNSTLKGRASSCVMPNLDAANIGYNLVRVMTEGVAIGPILMGLDQPAHILTPASTARRVVQHDRDRRGRGADPGGAAAGLRPNPVGAALPATAPATSTKGIRD